MTPCAEVDVMRTITALVCLLLATAGCLGLGDDATTPTGAPTNGSALDAAGQEAGDLTASALGFPGEARIERTLWANGSFAPHEACNTGVGCLTGDAFRAAEITGLPPDVPTILSVELSYDRGTTIFGSPITVELFSDDATFYQYTSAQPEAGHQRIEATVLGGPLAAQVRYGGTTGSTNDATEVPYTLAIHQRADPAWLPAGVPTALALETGDVVRLEPGTDGTLAGLLYGPDDEVVATFASDSALTLELPMAATPGEHVLVTRTGSPDARVTVVGTTGDLRALALTYTFGETHAVEQTAPVTWTFDVEGTPLAVGLVEVPANDLWVTLDGGTARVEAPGGTILEGPFGCSTCLSNGGTSDWVVSATADGALGPGTYTATVEHEAGLLLEVAAFTVGYQR